MSENYCKLIYNILINVLRDIPLINSRTIGTLFKYY